MAQMYVFAVQARRVAKCIPTLTRYSAVVQRTRLDDNDYDYEGAPPSTTGLAARLGARAALQDAAREYRDLT